MKIPIILPLLFMASAVIGYGEVLRDQITQFNTTLEKSPDQQAAALAELHDEIYEIILRAESPAEKNILKTQIARDLEPAKKQIVTFVHKRPVISPTDSIG